MAETNKAKAARLAKEKGSELSQLKASVETLSSAVSIILDRLEKSPTVSPVQAQDIVAPEVKAAGPNKVQKNDAWEDVAKDILGPALDHTEVEHEKSGGIKFTVVIKNEYSNASPQYLELNKCDRRTKEVSREGLAGVEDWCKTIKANLSRMQKVTVRQ